MSRRSLTTPKTPRKQQFPAMPEEYSIRLDGHGVRTF
jgi:hypothetical protein